MAEWGWAVLPLALGAWDMSVNHCPTGCLAPSETAPRTEFAFGATVFREETDGAEAYFRYDSGRRRGPFGLAYGVSVTDTGDVWAGIGASYLTALPLDGAFLQFHVMPGVHLQGVGPDLGGPFETRSGFEIGYEARSGVRYSLSVDHRSNAGVYDVNPGLETVMFRVSVPLR